MVRLLLILILSFNVYSAGMTSLTEMTALTDTDLLIATDDVGGTPTTKKITWANIKLTIDDTFVPYSGAIADLALGAKNFSLSGTADFNGVVDVGGVTNNVVFFQDVLVTDATASTYLGLKRHAAEGDTSFSMNINEYGTAVFTTAGYSGDCAFAPNSHLYLNSISGDVWLAQSGTANVNFFQYTDANRHVSQYGYITAASAAKYIRWAVEDSDDWFNLTRQDTNILGFDVEMPLRANTVQTDTGATIDEFSTDGTMAGNSDTAVPTEKAVKTYIDGKIGTSSVGQDCKNLVINGIDGGTFIVSYDTLQVGNCSLTSGSFTVDVDGGTGVLKLDTGTYTNATWYYIWVICKNAGADASAFISASSTTPTMPADYTQKRRVGSLRAVSSSAYRKFHTHGNGITMYDTYLTAVSGGTQTSFTAVDNSANMPATSTMFYAAIYTNDNAAGSEVQIRATGDTAGTVYVNNNNTGATGSVLGCTMLAPTNTSQSFDYKIASDDTNCSIFPTGYIDNL